MAENVEDKALAGESSLSPVASKRKSRILKQSGTPDAYAGPETKTLTALQQHDFVLLDGVLFSRQFSPFFFNFALSYATVRGWLPSLPFPVYVENINRDKHGSDTDIYDREGRFVPENFENLFTTYALSSPNKLTAAQLWKMTEDNREIYDFIGWIIAKVEWALLYFFAKDEDGFLSKEAVRGCFDGTLFEYMAMKHAEKMVKTS